MDTATLNATPDWYALHAKAHAPKQVEYRIQSTPQIAVDGMLKIMNPSKEDKLYDLGCGDGRIVITAAKRFGCKAVGIEIDEAVAKVARANVKAAGVEHLVTIIVADARSVKLDDADIVTLYLFPELMKELQPEIFKAKRIVSYSHRIPDVVNREWYVKHNKKEYPFYSWEKPTNKVF